jgi:hypothetical protein
MKRTRQNNNNAMKVAAGALCMLALALLSACATTSAVSPDDEVKARAEARWEALLARDYASAYDLYSPGYRSTISVTDFEIGIRLRRVRWITAEYLSQNCEESTCTVTFRVGYRVNSPVPGVDVWNGYDTIEDQWIKTGGEWWYLPAE